MLQELLPEEKLAAFTKTFKEEDASWRAAFAAITPSTQEAVAGTIALVVGFVVHDFLM
jgi:hypothetical protein